MVDIFLYKIFTSGYIIHFSSTFSLPEYLEISKVMFHKYLNIYTILLGFSCAVYLLGFSNYIFTYEHVPYRPVQLSFQNITTKYKLIHQISLGSSQSITTKYINISNLQTSSGSIISKVNTNRHGSKNTTFAYVKTSTMLPQLVMSCRSPEKTPVAMQTLFVTVVKILNRPQ